MYEWKMSSILPKDREAVVDVVAVDNKVSWKFTQTLCRRQSLVRKPAIQKFKLTRPWAKSAVKDLLPLCRMSGREVKVVASGACSNEGLGCVVGVDGVCAAGVVAVALPFKNVDIGTP